MSNLEGLAKSEYCSQVKDFLSEEIAKLSDLSTIKGTVEQKGKILEGRQEVEKILKKMFKILDFKPDKNILRTKYN
jgi:hypothetical protein